MTLRSLTRHRVSDVGSAPWTHGSRPPDSRCVRRVPGPALRSGFRQQLTPGGRQSEYDTMGLFICRQDRAQGRQAT